MPRSLQQRINALLLQPSEAVGNPDTSKKSCSPLACDTKRPLQINAYSREIFLGEMVCSPRGANPQPPGPNALFKIRLYLISGK
jgi:hypothetical protein